MKKQQKDKKVKKDRREKLRYIREVSAEQRGRILLSCLTGILGVAFALAFIYATKRVIDTATGITDDNLTHIAVLTVVLLTAQLLCGAADTWISTRMQIETGNALRHRLFSRLLQSRWNELERFHTGDVVNRVEQDTTAIVTLLTSSVPAFIVTSIQLLAAFLFFYFLDPSLPWLIVAILPVFLSGSRFYMRRMKRYTHDIRNSDGRIQSVIQESLQHRIVIKTLEQGERHLDKLDDLQDMLHSQVMGYPFLAFCPHVSGPCLFRRIPHGFSLGSRSPQRRLYHLRNDDRLFAIGRKSPASRVRPLTPDTFRSQCPYRHRPAIGIGKTAGRSGW